jgi:hypothetical protein
MSLQHVFDAAGAVATLDDMSPAARALALLLEHAARRRDAQLPGPCTCAVCERVRACLCAERTEIPGEVRLIYTPPVTP